MKLLKDLKIGVMAIALAITGVSAMPVAAFATDGTLKIGNVEGIRPDDLKPKGNLQENVKNIINAVLALIGFVSVVMIIYGGFLYTISAGESDKVKKAKNTILYGVIGLVIALLAFAIVQFVISNILNINSAGTGTGAAS